MAFTFSLRTDAQLTQALTDPFEAFGVRVKTKSQRGYQVRSSQLLIHIDLTILEDIMVLF